MSSSPFTCSWERLRSEALQQGPSPFPFLISIPEGCGKEEEARIKMKEKMSIGILNPMTGHIY